MAKSPERFYASDPRVVGEAFLNMEIYPVCKTTSCFKLL